MKWSTEPVNNLLYHTFSVPDDLVDEVVGVLSSEHSQGGACWNPLLKTDHLGVDGEDGRLVHVLNGNGDSCCGLKGRLDAGGQVGLVGYDHGQHERTVHLEVDWLRRKQEGGRWPQHMMLESQRCEDNVLSHVAPQSRDKVGRVFTLITVSMPSLVMGLVRMVKWPEGSPLTMR